MVGLSPMHTGKVSLKSRKREAETEKQQKYFGHQVLLDVFPGVQFQVVYKNQRRPSQFFAIGLGSQQNDP